MEWKKLKNLIILILLMVNGFLLVLVESRREESVRYERTALEQTVRVLEQGGIEVDLDAVAGSAALAPMAVERDLEREAALAWALLDEEAGQGGWESTRFGWGTQDGEAQGENRGGGLYLYHGTWGEVRIRTGGELSAEFEDGGHWSTDHPEQHAAALLDKLGIEAEQVGAAGTEGQTTVRFRQNWNGAPVFSCEVEFVYRDGRLRSLSGSLLMAEAGTAEAGTALTLPTALMRFSEEIAATGDVCSAIRSMEAGYRGTVQSLSGGTRLAPVWLVTTNTAGYYLDCATGVLTRAVDQ